MSGYTTPGISTSTVITGGTASRFVVTNSAGAITTPASLLASTGGAGNGVLTFLDTPTGANANSNFLSIVGTSNATLSAQFNAVRIAPTFVTQNQNQVGLSISTVSSGGNITSIGAAAFFQNNQVGTGTQVLGAFGTSTVQTGLFVDGSNANGKSVSIHGRVSTSGANDSAAVIGDFQGASSGVGLWGNASGANSKIGVLATQGFTNTMPALTNACFMADNGSGTADMFILRDNATIITQVIDGGQWNFGNNVVSNAASATRCFISGTKTLTEGSATTFATINMTSGSSTGVWIQYTIEANDATDFQSRSGACPVAAVNKAGTASTTVGTVGTATEVFKESAGASTLTNTFTAVNSGGNVLLQANATSSLTQTTLQIVYMIWKLAGTGNITPA